jgi:hypothetical protein
MSPTEKHEILMSLIKVLRSACHAPECETFRICPNQCDCRIRRDFKTNNETAICWQLADEIFTYLRGSRKLIRHKTRLESHAIAYLNLSEYHMTKGWSNLYKRAFQIIRMLLNPVEYFNPETSIAELLVDMRGSINRLKREAKG